MNITEKQKRELFTLAKEIRISRDTALDLFDQATTKKQKEYFLRMSMIHAAKEYGIIICFQTLGLSKEFAEFIGDTRHHLPILLFEKALAAEKKFYEQFPYLSFDPFWKQKKRTAKVPGKSGRI